MKELLQESVELTANESDGMEVICPEWAVKDVSTASLGEVRHIIYFSKTAGLERGANILLPAGYDTAKKYKVLYFLHGIFGDEFSMLNDENSRIRQIVANVAPELIVVFPNMFVTTDPEFKPGFSAEQVVPYDRIVTELDVDLIPYIEANYPVLTGKKNRALVGFSMGGRETVFIGVTRSDLFDAFGAFAPAPGVVPSEDGFMKHVGMMAESEVYLHKSEDVPSLFMINCGSKDSVVGKYPLSYHLLFEKNGIEHLWYEVPGADHDFNDIRSGLYNFLIRWKA